MAEQPCLPQVQGVRMRAALLDQDGTPQVGADKSIVIDGFVTVGVTPTYEAGTEIKQENAAGAVCVSFLPPPTYKWDAITIQLCAPDPYAEAMLGGGTILSGFDGDRVGYAGPPLGVVNSQPISLEVWAIRLDHGAQDADSPFAHWAYPLLKNLQVGQYTHQSGAILPQFSGIALENPNWGDGPGNDFLGATDRTNQWVPDDVLPDVECGYVTTIAS